MTLRAAWQSVNWQSVGYWAGLRAATPLAHDDGYNFLRFGRASPFTGINYCEVGNEEYGTWEIDHYAPSGYGGNSTSPYNYPAAYAQFAASFSAFASADKSLPSILVGIDSGDPSGTSDNNWTKNVLADGLADGFVPGFISDHSYMQGPGAESDSFLLNDTVSNPVQHRSIGPHATAITKPPSSDRGRQGLGRPHHGHGIQLQLWHPGQADDQPGQWPVRCRLHRQPARQRIHRRIVLGPA